MARLQKARRVHQPKGKIAIIHWNFDASTPSGPSMSIRPKPGQCRARAEEVGSTAVLPADINLPPYHYGLLLERDRDDQRRSDRSSFHAEPNHDSNLTTINAPDPP